MMFCRKNSIDMVRSIYIQHDTMIIYVSLGTIMPTQMAEQVQVSYLKHDNANGQTSLVCRYWQAWSRRQTESWTCPGADKCVQGRWYQG
jgi:hypothetical protein